MSNARIATDEAGKFTIYLFEYGHKGARWGIEVKATDPEDARERLGALAFAQFRGEVVAKVPLPRFASMLAPLKFLARLVSARS